MKQYTISTHGGTAVHQAHNRREPRCIEKEEHIDKNGNYEIWGDMSLKQAYKEIFEPYVEEYNARQTRADRQIKDYYNQICNDAKRNLVYELICAIGNKDDRPPDELGKQILREYAEDFIESNPNLAVIGLYYHNDEEGTPHVHIDYIPLKFDCKRGMSVQNSLTGALEQMGYKSKTHKLTAQMQWTKEQNRRLESICRKHGLDIVHPLVDKKIEHLDTQQYKAVMETATKDKQQALEQLQSIKRELESLEQQRTEHNARVQALEGKHLGIEGEGIKHHKNLMGKEFVTLPKELFREYTTTRNEVVQLKNTTEKVEQWVKEVEDNAHENSLLKQDIKRLQREVRAWERTVKQLDDKSQALMLNLKADTEHEITQSRITKEVEPDR